MLEQIEGSAAVARTVARCRPEVVAAYGHRVDIPASKWNDLLARARRSIDIVGYAFLFLPEQHMHLTSSVQEKCEAGCKVRIALADPHGARLPERDTLEGLKGTLAARIQMTLKHLEPLDGMPGVELRYHDVHLYNAIYRFDEDDRLLSETIYYDRAAVLAQLGVFREPDTTMGRLCMFVGHPLRLANAWLRSIWSR